LERFENGNGILRGTSRTRIDGCRDPETADCRYVERALTAPPENPFPDAAQGWLLGSLEFVFGLGHGVP
jgi:hypothetical protein